MNTEKKPCRFNYEGACNLRYIVCEEPESCESYTEDKAEIVPEEKQEA